MSEFWDQRYADETYAYGMEPNAFLRMQRHRLPEHGRCLAVGDGEGRNGVWLAEQGLDVLSVDASAVGLQKARALAQAHGVKLETECVDLTTWTWPRDAYDCVVSIFVHFPPTYRARMHQAMYDALKPGGVLIIEAFTPEQLQYRSGGPPVTEMLYTSAMLRADFPRDGFIVVLEEMTTPLQEGLYHRGEAAVVRLVLMKSVKNKTCGT